MQTRNSIILAAAVMLAAGAAMPALAQSEREGRATPENAAQRALPADETPAAGATGDVMPSTGRSANRALDLDPAAAKRAWTLIGRNSDGSEVRIEPSERILRAIQGEDHGSIAPRGGTAVAEEEADRNVVGKDDRERVADTEAYPYSTVGYLESKNVEGLYGSCTATMIGPSTAVTAAQCLYNHAEKGGWRDEFRFWPGLNGADTKPFGSHGYKTAYVFEGFVTAYDGTYDSIWGYDVGVIEFAEPIGQDMVGWTGFRNVTNDDAFEAVLVGYHRDTDDEFAQRRSGCKVPSKNIGDYDYVHSCDAGPGASGSPLMIRDSQSGDPRIVAIHIGSEGDASWALRLHPTLFDWLYEISDK